MGDEIIDLDIEDVNELFFRISIDGAPQSAAASVRLVCESGDVSYMFSGAATGEDDTVTFTLPKMQGKIEEGECEARVEVFVENRYFVPIQFRMRFKKQVRVVAEAISRPVITRKPDISVTAQSVRVKAKKPRRPEASDKKAKPAGLLEALYRSERAKRAKS